MAYVIVARDDVTDATETRMTYNPDKALGYLEGMAARYPTRTVTLFGGDGMVAVARIERSRFETDWASDLAERSSRSMHVRNALANIRRAQSRKAG